MYAEVILGLDLLKEGPDGRIYVAGPPTR